MGHNQIKLPAAISDIAGAENQALRLQIGQRLCLRPLTPLMGFLPGWPLMRLIPLTPLTFLTLLVPLIHA
ncbi:MAG: hypothetical protein RL258_75 [Pseudomonadota bacterium]